MLWFCPALCSRNTTIAYIFSSMWNVWWQIHTLIWRWYFRPFYSKMQQEQLGILNIHVAPRRYSFKEHLTPVNEKRTQTWKTNLFLSLKQNKVAIGLKVQVIFFSSNKDLTPTALVILLLLWMLHTALKGPCCQQDRKVCKYLPIDMASYSTIISLHQHHWEKFKLHSCIFRVKQSMNWSAFPWRRRQFSPRKCIWLHTHTS
jgi:hypothetical protein